MASRILQSLALLLVLVGSRLPAAEPLSLIDLADPAQNSRLAPGGEQVTGVIGPGLTVRIAAGEAGYPGIGIKPVGEAWDLSAYGHVEAQLANIGDQPVSVSLRVDNTGDWQKNPWNTESTYLKPGESKALKVIFGYQYGLKPGYKLDSAKVVNLLFFTGKAKEPLAFRIESIVAGGEPGETPPVDPRDVRIKPVEGHLLGGKAIVDAAKQIEAKDGATGEVVTEDGSQALRFILPAGKSSHTVSFRPPIGRWNLTEGCVLVATVKNVGAVPFTPTVAVTSDPWHSTDSVAGSELAPGATAELVVPFAAAKVWQGPVGELDKKNLGGVKGTGSSFASNKADAVVFTVKHEGEATMLVESVTIAAPAIEPPAWQGKRPPVEGDWVLTFSDEFDGPTIDQDRWNIYTENYWDKVSHFSKDNLILGDGLVRLRMERKDGHENDDPKRKQTPYAVGFLNTAGKWAQRYGYFEARMKLPTEPGMWPAFWLMPDRGPLTNPQSLRGSTGEGGMEFDIMEYLSRWGVYRYNIAMHWDGYGKDHKSTGTGNVYVQADPEGFITSGLLWTPGSAVFYCNGQVVATWENDRVSSVPSYPMFDMVTGGWDNDPVDDSKLPSDFVIDYIRIWQRQDLASDVDGKMISAAAARAIFKAPNAPPATGEILATAADVDPASIQQEGATVEIVEDKGAKVLQAQFPAGKGYPAFVLPVAKDGWNLSAFTGVQVDVTNRGEAEVKVALRVDNDGDWHQNPWNTEGVTLQPGETKTIQVTFGKSYGGNPGFALNPANVIAFKVFADRPQETATVLVRNLKAFGTAQP